MRHLKRTKELLLAKSGKTRAPQHVRIVTDYNPLNKINIHVSTLIINKQMGEKGKLFFTIEFQPINTEEIRVRKFAICNYHRNKPRIINE